MAEIFLRTLAVVMILVYVYVPCTCIYGIAVLLADGFTEKLMCNPFLGIKKVSLKQGAIAWAVQFMFLGVMFAEFYFYFAHDTHPFFMDFYNF